MKLERKDLLTEHTDLSSCHWWVLGFRVWVNPKPYPNRLCSIILLFFFFWFFSVVLLLQPNDINKVARFYLSHPRVTAFDLLFQGNEFWSQSTHLVLIYNNRSKTKPEVLFCSYKFVRSFKNESLTPRMPANCKIIRWKSAIGCEQFDIQDIPKQQNNLCWR